MGLVVSITHSESTRYLATQIFYIATLAIFLTASVLIYGSRRQHAIFRGVLECFELDEKQRMGFMVRGLDRHSNFKRQLTFSLIIFICTLTLAYTACFPTWIVDHAASFLNTMLPKFRVFDEKGWYLSSSVKTGFWIVAVYTPWIATLLGTSLSIILSMPRFFFDISSLPPRFPPSLIKAKFSTATDIYSKVSLLWLLGVCALYYFFGKNGDYLSYSVVAVMFFLGALNFLVPQFAYVRVVSASEDKYIGLVAKQIEASSNLVAKGVDGESRPLAATELAGLVALTKHDIWVYPVHQTYVVFGSYLLSVLGSIVGWRAILDFIVV